MLTISQILAPATPAQVRASLVISLVQLGIPANQWASGGVASTLLTVVATLYSMMSTQLANIVASFFLPTAVQVAIQTGNSNLLILLATYVYGVTVPTATFASGSYVLTNTTGVNYNVAAGTFLASNPTTGQAYGNPSAFTIPAGGSVTTTLVCTTPGSIGNAGAGTVTTLVTPLLGVTGTNPAAFVGLDPPTPTQIQALCMAALGARSVRGPRSAYAYCIMTATNAVTGQPVNINRWTISESSHTGQVTIVICGPNGTTDPNDLAGVQQAIEGLQSAPFGGARPGAVTVTVSAASPITYAPILTPTVLAPAGTSSTAIQNAIVSGLATFMQSQTGNPIGGVLATDDTGTQQGLFAAGVYGAVSAAIATVPGCAMVTCRGASDLALSSSQVAVNAITVNTPSLVSPPAS